MNNQHYTFLLTDLPAEAAELLPPYSMNKITLIPPIHAGLAAGNSDDDFNVVISVEC